MTQKPRGRTIRPLPHPAEQDPTAPDILDELAKQPFPEPYASAAAAARPSKQDSSPTELTAADRALQWADDIRSRPLNDTQAIELAKVYALLAIHERMPVPRKPNTRTTKDS